VNPSAAQVLDVVGRIAPEALPVTSGGRDGAFRPVAALLRLVGVRGRRGQGHGPGASP